MTFDLTPTINYTCGMGTFIIIVLVVLVMGMIWVSRKIDDL